MTTVTISALPSANTLTGAEILAGVQSAATKGVTVDQIKTYISAARRARFVIGDGSSASFTLTHGFATKDVRVEIYRNGSPWDTVFVSVTRPDSNNVTVSGFGSTPTSNAYVVLVSE